MKKLFALLLLCVASCAYAEPQVVLSPQVCAAASAGVITYTWEEQLYFNQANGSTIVGASDPVIILHRCYTTLTLCTNDKQVNANVDQTVGAAAGVYTEHMGRAIYGCYGESN